MRYPHPSYRSIPPWERPAYRYHSGMPPQRGFGSGGGRPIDGRRRWPRAYDGGEDPRNSNGNPHHNGERAYHGEAQRAHNGDRRPRYEDNYRASYNGERRHGDQGPAQRRNRPYDRDMRERRSPYRRTGLDRLRDTPVRNGLIGLAMVGTAVPIAVSRYQNALRTDSGHEQMTSRTMAGRITDSSIMDAWSRMESSRANEQQAREMEIQDKIERYAEFGLERDLAEEIYDAASEVGVEPDVAFGLVRAESSFKNQATSPVGAVGLTQLMPNTAEWLEPGISRSELRDPSINLRIGFKYLRDLIRKYDGDTNLALTAYNRGPGTVDRALKRGQNPDNGYADFVYGKQNHGHSLYTH